MKADKFGLPLGPIKDRHRPAYNLGYTDGVNSRKTNGVSEELKQAALDLEASLVPWREEQRDDLANEALAFIDAGEEVVRLILGRGPGRGPASSYE